MPTTISTHSTASSAQTALSALLTEGARLVGFNTWRLADGTGARTNLGHEWEVQSLTVAECDEIERWDLENKAEAADVRAAHYEARAAASRFNRENNVRSAESERAKAAEFRARAAALTAQPLTAKVA